jgi:hypothetical protein
MHPYEINLYDFERSNFKIFTRWFINFVYPFTGIQSNDSKTESINLQLLVDSVNKREVDLTVRNLEGNHAIHVFPG